MAEMSEEEKLNEIDSAFDRQFNGMPTSPGVTNAHAWVSATFDDHVIATWNGQVFRVSYRRIEDDVLFVPFNEFGLKPPLTHLTKSIMAFVKIQVIARLKSLHER